MKRVRDGTINPSPPDGGEERHFNSGPFRAEEKFVGKRGAARVAAITLTHPLLHTSKLSVPGVFLWPFCCLFGFFSFLFPPQSVCLCFEASGFGR